MDSRSFDLVQSRAYDRYYRGQSIPPVTVPAGPTPERILDAAEELFAVHGYDGVSTRAITELAGVRLNLLSYHFGSKERLFQTVIDRRLEVIASQREAALARLRDSGAPVTVGGILEAFMHPYLALAQADRGWLNHARLVALLGQSERDHQAFEAHMQPAMGLFIAALRDVLPGVPRKTIRQGFYFAITLMLASFSGVNRIPGLAEGTRSIKALERAYRPVIVYAEAGMLALAGAERAASRPATR